MDWVPIWGLHIVHIPALEAVTDLCSFKSLDRWFVPEHLMTQTSKGDKLMEIVVASYLFHRT